MGQNPFEGLNVNISSPLFPHSFVCVGPRVWLRHIHSISLFSVMSSKALVIILEVFISWPRASLHFTNMSAECGLGRDRFCSTCRWTLSHEPSQPDKALTSSSICFCVPKVTIRKLTSLRDEGGDVLLSRTENMHVFALDLRRTAVTYLPVSLFYL